MFKFQWKPNHPIKSSLKQIIQSKMICFPLNQLRHHDIKLNFNQNAKLHQFESIKMTLKAYIHKKETMIRKTSMTRNLRTRAKTIAKIRASGELMDLKALFRTIVSNISKIFTIIQHQTVVWANLEMQAMQICSLAVLILQSS